MKLCVWNFRIGFRLILQPLTLVTLVDVINRTALGKWKHFFIVADTGLDHLFPLFEIIGHVRKEIIYCQV